MICAHTIFNSFYMPLFYWVNNIDDREKILSNESCPWPSFSFAAPASLGRQALL